MPRTRKTASRTPPENTSPDDPVEAYARAVLAGEVVAGPHVRNSCRRHIKDSKEQVARGLKWDLQAAQRAIQFFPDVLRLRDGQFDGEPFVLHPSQQFIVGSLFGWKWAGRGTRRFRRAYIEEGKGNGKTPMIAGIGLYGMMADGEAGAQIYAAAARKDQANVLFNDAVRMVQQSPPLSARITASGINPVWNLADLKTGSFFRPISKEAGKTGSGPRPHMALCDEVHEHPDRYIMEMLERGFKFRRNPLLLMITNSGTDRNSVCWEEHDHAVKVASGEVDDDTSFSFVCSLDDEDEPLDDPSCWVKANPLLGTILTEDYLAGVVAQAKALPGKLNGILRLHFCRWTDVEQAWMSKATLDSVTGDFDPLEHSGEEVYAGLDLSATQDLTVAAFVVETGFNEAGRPVYDAWIEAFTPADTLRERALRDKAHYDQWVTEGHLHATPGKVIGFEFVAARIADAAAIYRLAVLAYDIYGFNKHFEPELDAIGLTLPVVEHPQGGKKKGAESGLWMPGSKLMLESLILEKRIRLRRNPVLTLAMLSASTEHDPYGNFWFSKRNSVNRIDALIALAMAVGAATMHEAVRLDIAAMIG